MTDRNRDGRAAQRALAREDATKMPHRWWSRVRRGVGGGRRDPPRCCGLEGGHDDAREVIDLEPDLRDVLRAYLPGLELWS